MVRSDRDRDTLRPVGPVWTGSPVGPVLKLRRVLLSALRVTYVAHCCTYSTSTCLPNDPQPDAIYADEHLRTIGTLHLSRTVFALDNGAVFDSLKSYILAGPAWPWIQKFDKSRNGRAAWKALAEHTTKAPAARIRLSQLPML